MDLPAGKKVKIEELTDYTKCIICQKITDQQLAHVVAKESLENVLFSFIVLNLYSAFYRTVGHNQILPCLTISCVNMKIGQLYWD